MVIERVHCQATGISLSDRFTILHQRTVPVPLPIVQAPATTVSLSPSPVPASRGSFFTKGLYADRPQEYRPLPLSRPRPRPHPLQEYTPTPIHSYLLPFQRKRPVKQRIGRIDRPYHPLALSRSRLGSRPRPELGDEIYDYFDGRLGPSPFRKRKNFKRRRPANRFPRRTSGFRNRRNTRTNAKWMNVNRRGFRKKTSDGDVITKERLDEELDSYMAGSKLELDRDLDTYMRNVEEGETGI